MIRCTPWGKDISPTLRFAVHIQSLAVTDSFVGKSVVYKLPSGTTIFNGQCEDYLEHYEHIGWVRDYSCLGLKHLATYIPVTDHVSLTDTARYNLAADDPFVILSRQGRNVGQIVTDVLTNSEVSTMLNAAGLMAYTSMGPPAVLPSATIAALANLTVIPPYEVQLAGERVLEACQAVIQSSHPNHWINIEPDGTMRVYDPRTYTPLTLTLGSADRVNLPQLRRDVTNNYQRVVVRGNTLVQAITLQTQPWPGSSDTDGGLQEDFGHDGLTNAQAKAAWQVGDFQSPQTGQNAATAQGHLSGSTLGSVTPLLPGSGYVTAPGVVVVGGGGSGATVTATLGSGGTAGTVVSYTVTAAGSGYTSVPGIFVDAPNHGAHDIGTCTCPSTTQVTYTSTHTTYHWPANYWDQSSTGAQGQVILRVDATAGVTQYHQARIIANTALTAGGSCTLTIDIPMPITSYTACRIIGTGTGASLVWRKYKISNSAIGAAMVPYAPYPCPFVAPDGLSAGMTTTPIGYIIQGILYKTGAFTIDPDSGHIYFNKPTCLAFSGDQITPVQPDNVEALVMVSVGTLTATYPPDSGGPVYAGTSHTVEGLTRTKYITVNDWRDYSNATNMLTYATEMHGAISDTVVEGTVVVDRIVTEVLTPGRSLNIAGNVYTTNLESINVPIVSVDIDFNETGGGTSYTTTMHCTSRRSPYSAATFQRPNLQSRSAIGAIEGSFDFGGSGASYGGTATGVQDLSGPQWEGGIFAPIAGENNLRGGGPAKGLDAFQAAPIVIKTDADSDALAKVLNPTKDLGGMAG